MSEAPTDAKQSESALEMKVRALAERTRRGLPKRAAALREAAAKLGAGEADAASELRRLAHRLHGTAGSYGMHALGQAAAELEALATEGGGPELQRAALELAAACEASAITDNQTDDYDNVNRNCVTKPDVTASKQRVLALVVDDDPAIGKLVGLLLERMGDYRVEVVDAPVKALARLDAGFTPALLVVDAMMPEMNGRALAQAVRGRPGFERLPVAVLSAASPQELGWDDGEFTPDAWITKPVRAAELLSALRKLR